MGNISKIDRLDGLGNHAVLEKQNMLREIGVDIPTSEIVVVGGQSSGKSSLLENLTGVPFPRGQGLCTRFATQITLRRSDVRSIVISIIPRPDADEDLKERLRAFRHELDEFDGGQLPEIMEKANEVMGIRAGESKDDMSLPMFSDDILKVEISGPDEHFLTVIDVPGLFEVTSTRVTEYDTRSRTWYSGTCKMSEPCKPPPPRIKLLICRSLTLLCNTPSVLAVLSCLSDPATEGVLQLAKAADPKGVRTVGVLTKADLVKEQAVIQGLTQLVKGNSLKLGYFIVRNRGADEDDLDISECRRKEKTIFAEPIWSEIAKSGRLGIEALREELQILLTELVKRELPKQCAEVDQQLSDARRKLQAMGAPRDTSASQRECLIKLASEFERIVRDALDGRYEGDAIFQDTPAMKLVTRIIGLNEGFSDLMWKRGHMWNFSSKSKSKSSEKEENEKEEDEKKKERPLDYELKAEMIHRGAAKIPELQGLVCADTAYLPPPDKNIMIEITNYYSESRGPELGTFGGSLLAMTFRAQTRKWRNIVMVHVEAIIVEVHCFIKTLLEHVFVDRQMRDELWNSVLLDKLRAGYQEAKKQAEFLLDIELNGRPSTYNHYFNDNLQKARAERLTEAFRGAGTEKSEDGKTLFEVGNAALTTLATDRSNAEQVMEDIHDILKSYYKVSRKRFVDSICRLVIDHCLLAGKDSPLMLLKPQLIARMSDEQLDMVAGEDAATKRERKRLESEIAKLEASLKVLRG